MVHLLLGVGGELPLGGAHGLHLGGQCLYVVDHSRDIGDSHTSLPPDDGRSVASSEFVNDLTKMQRKLFKSAFNALKPNGTLVYSTCTLNKQENEEILQWALDNFNVKLLPINIEIKEALHAFNEGMSKDLNKAIRILPSKNMEGFFVSKFIKG